MPRHTKGRSEVTQLAVTGTMMWGPDPRLSLLPSPTSATTSAELQATVTPSAGQPTCRARSGPSPYPQTSSSRCPAAQRCFPWQGAQAYSVAAKIQDSLF